MKKYLLPPGGQFYKANLHCHTTCSDGNLSPEAVAESTATLAKLIDNSQIVMIPGGFSGGDR